jgi:cystathionine beta-lyase
MPHTMRPRAPLPIGAPSRAEFARVLHPALPGSPGHDHWKSHCRAAAGLVSVIFAAGVEPARVDAFVDALKLFRIGWSWGGPVSLAVPYDLALLRDGTPESQGRWCGSRSAWKRSTT